MENLKEKLVKIIREAWDEEKYMWIEVNMIIEEAKEEVKNEN